MRERKLQIFLLGGIGVSFHLNIDRFIHNSARQIFPGHSPARCLLCKNSALARIKEKRLELKAASSNSRAQQ
jgi:hypothetical protein